MTVSASSSFMPPHFMKRVATAACRHKTNTTTHAPAPWPCPCPGPRPCPRPRPGIVAPEGLIFKLQKYKPHRKTQNKKHPQASAKQTSTHITKHKPFGNAWCIGLPWPLVLVSGVCPESVGTFCLLLFRMMMNTSHGEIRGLHGPSLHVLCQCASVTALDHAL